MITVVRNAILLVAVACVGCRPAPRTTVFIDPALSTLVPADTVFLAGLRLDKLRDTPAYKKFLSSVPLPGAEQFRRDRAQMRLASRIARASRDVVVRRRREHREPPNPKFDCGLGFAGGHGH